MTPELNFSHTRFMCADLARSAVLICWHSCFVFGDLMLDYRPSRWLFLLNCFVFSLSPSRLFLREYLKIGHVRFVSQLSSITINNKLHIRHCTSYKYQKTSPNNLRYKTYYLRIRLKGNGTHYKALSRYPVS
jgi:hypothetical protein